VQALALYLTVLALSTCGLVFELVAATTASYLAGDSVTRFATVVGAHLSAMGVGAWLTRHVTEQPGRRLLDAQLAAALAGGATAPMVFLAYGRGAWMHGVLYFMVFLTGLFVGAEVPLLLRVLRRRVDLRTLLARVLGVEYAGALVGSLLFALVALPRLGTLRAGVAFGLANALSGFAALRALGPDLGPRDDARRRITLTTAALVALFVGSFRLSRQADEDVSLGPVLYAEQTHYQRIVVTRQHGGTNLFLDGNLQFASWDEHRYHEALVHPALAAAPRRTRVMILGGGDGLAAREVLRYRDVSSVTLVDLDPAMTALARRAPWLRALNQNALHDPRVTGGERRRHGVAHARHRPLRRRSGGLSRPQQLRPRKALHPALLPAPARAAHRRGRGGGAVVVGPRRAARVLVRRAHDDLRGLRHRALSRVRAVVR
jgi:spermidine synthase